MKVAALVVVMLAGGAMAADFRQRAGFIDPLPVARLRQLFPAAAFVPRGTADPLYFAAYAGDPAAPTARPIAYAFWTTDLVPEQLGYHGSCSSARTRRAG